MKKSPPFYRPVWAEINHKNLKHNFLELKKRLSPKTSILAVVKANAYGHGMVSVSRTLTRLGAKFLGVTSLEESLALKSAGVRTPSLILGNIYPFSNLEVAIKNNVRVSVASIESALECESAAKRLKKKVYAHAKIDTGMNRIGVNIKGALAFVEKIHSLKSVVLEGIYTHFASSYEDPDFTAKQIRQFTELLEQLKSRGIHIPFVHDANSGGIFKYPDAHFTLVRPGISLYGVLPVKIAEVVNLKPVLSWKSRIIFLKRVPPGTPVSYAGTFKTKRPSVIATAAFGYADGFRRCFSNKARVLVRGRRVPVVGRVTMDMTMLDVTEAPETKVGDEVILIGAEGRDAIRVQELAAWAETSPYEIFCGISARVPRVDL